MLRSYDTKSTTLTKIALQQIKKPQFHLNNTTENNPDNALQSYRSERSINTLITPRINPYEYKKKASLFIRNSIRCILRKHFRRMLSRLMIRKMCFKLLKTKGKRDLQRGFLTIRDYTQQRSQKVIHQFYHRMPELKIFASIFNKILAKPEREVISRIRSFTLRKRRLEHFVKCLVERVESRFLKEGAGAFWSIVHLQAGKGKQKQSATYQLVKWGIYHIKAQLQESLAKIKDCRLSEQSWQKAREQKQKQQKVIGNAANRKQVLAKLRQQLKTTKASIDQQKLAKNKVFQQHKKFTHANKIEMAENVRKYEKELKVEEASFKEVEDEYNQWARLLEIRKTVANKGVGSENRCFQIYSQLHKESDSLIKQLQNYVPNLKGDVQEFRQDEICLFLNNLRMSKLVELYEKRQPYNYEAEYYELQYENNVLRETIRCFLREKYEAFIAMKRWENTRSQKSLHSA